MTALNVSAGRELDGDSRGYRSAEEQARELTRCIRREVNKLSEKWNALIDRSDQWQRKLDDSHAVSTRKGRKETDPGFPFFRWVLMTYLVMPSRRQLN